ncbi:hypothetical protein [Celeribacter naphthalenivorans]|uniref:hypothetical protein n=1 Tax=Celeribacter naphthalenivorans TaxID=1614694 RepID=UPI001CF9FCF8|nr:hypothetical protein [Celeribacter naphthalenivorans]
MAHDVRSFISDLGGYRSVALRLGKKPTTVHTHMQAGALPAAWYDALCDLARELGKAEPKRAFFSFVPLVALPEEKAA